MIIIILLWRCSFRESQAKTNVLNKYIVLLRLAPLHPNDSLYFANVIFCFAFENNLFYFNDLKKPPILHAFVLFPFHDMDAPCAKRFHGYTEVFSGLLFVLELTESDPGNICF